MCKHMGKGLDTIRQELFDYIVSTSPLLDGAQVKWKVFIHHALNYGFHKP